MELPFHRYLNLIYYYLIREASPEDRKKLDNLLTQATESVIGTRNGSAPRKRTPSWWTNEDEAAASSIEAARSLGFNVGQVT